MLIIFSHGWYEPVWWPVAVFTYACGISDADAEEGVVTVLAQVQVWDDQCQTRHWSEHSSSSVIKTRKCSWEILQDASQHLQVTTHQTIDKCHNHESAHHHLCFSITVENTYDNIDNLGEVTVTSEDDYEPEETYIIPNSVSMPASQTNYSSITSPATTSQEDRQQGKVFYSHYSKTVWTRIFKKIPKLEMQRLKWILWCFQQWKQDWFIGHFNFVSLSNQFE